MEIKGILIDPKDQVVTVAKEVRPGDRVYYSFEKNTREIISKANIPQYHKIAAAYIAKGSKVYKYGEEIGTATEDIEMGEWVHIHNLMSSCMIGQKVRVKS